MINKSSVNPYTNKLVFNNKRVKMEASEAPKQVAGIVFNKKDIMVGVTKAKYEKLVQAMKNADIKFSSMKFAIGILQETVQIIIPLGSKITEVETGCQFIICDPTKTDQEVVENSYFAKETFSAGTEFDDGEGFILKSKEATSVIFAMDFAFELPEGTTLQTISKTKGSSKAPVRVVTQTKTTVRLTLDKIDPEFAKLVKSSSSPSKYKLLDKIPEQFNLSSDAIYSSLICEIDNKVYLVTMTSNKIRMIDVQTGTVYKSFDMSTGNGSNLVSSNNQTIRLAYYKHFDSNYLVYASVSNIYVLNIETGNVAMTYSDSNNIITICVHQMNDQTYIICSIGNNNISIHNIDDFSNPKIFAVKKYSAVTLDVGEIDGKCYLVAGKFGSEIQIFDFPSGNYVKELTPFGCDTTSSQSTEITFHNNHIYCATLDKKVYKISLEGTIIGQYPYANRVYAMQINTLDGKDHIITGTEVGEIYTTGIDSSTTIQRANYSERINCMSTYVDVDKTYVFVSLNNGTVKTLTFDK